MPTDTPTPKAPAASPVKTITLDEVKLWLKQVKDKVDSYLGKPGYNPVLWWRDSGGQDLEKQLGSVTNHNQEFFKRVLDFKFEEPKI